MTSHAISEQEAKEKLTRMGQTQLLEGWETLLSSEQEYFLSQVGQIDEELFRLQRNPPSHLHHKAMPYSHAAPSHDCMRGKEMLAAGRCGAIILAGGMGSRLRFEGPKGCFPISTVKKKSLFQLVAEKIRAASQQVGHPLQAAIMTSPLTHCEIETFFVQNAFFGLDPNQVSFFYQPMWPLLDLTGNLFLSSPGRIAFGPNGNGAVLSRFVQAGIWDAWNALGITHVSTIQIDNPLALPFDPALFSAGEQAKMTLSTTPKSHPDEKVGVIADLKGKAHILEYFELLPEERGKYPLANIGTYCFSMPFIKRAACAALPLHRAQKAVVRDGILPQEPNAWKYEKFIIDLPPLAHSVTAVICPRETYFAPLKNFCGEDSIETVQAALLAADRQTLSAVLGVSPPLDGKTQEVAQEFYYPTPELIARWRGKTWPKQAYIEAT